LSCRHGTEPLALIVRRAFDDRIVDPPRYGHDEHRHCNTRQDDQSTGEPKGSPSASVSHEQPPSGGSEDPLARGRPPNAGATGW
jgi:hypothetical protein